MYLKDIMMIEQYMCKLTIWEKNKKELREKMKFDNWNSKLSGWITQPNSTAHDRMNLLPERAEKLNKIN